MFLFCHNSCITCLPKLPQHKRSAPSRSILMNTPKIELKERRVVYRGLQLVGGFHRQCKGSVYLFALPVELGDTWDIGELR